MYNEMIFFLHNGNIPDDKLSLFKKQFSAKIKYISSPTLPMLVVRTKSSQQDVITALERYEPDLHGCNVIYEINDISHYEFFYCTNIARYGAPEIDFAFPDNEKGGFDMSNYCPKCKLGKRQNKPLALRGIRTSSARRKLLVDPSFWLVNEEAKKHLVGCSLTGINYIPVYNQKFELIKEIIQIAPDNIISGSLAAECVAPTNRNKDCHCGNKDYVIPDANCIYMNTDCEKKLLDFNELDEREFPGDKGFYIVSKKMMLSFISAGIRISSTMRFYPVHFR